MTKMLERLRWWLLVKLANGRPVGINLSFDDRGKLIIKSGTLLSHCKCGELRLRNDFRMETS